MAVFPAFGHVPERYLRDGPLAIGRDSYCQEAPVEAPAAFEGDDAAAWEAMKSVMSRKPFEARTVKPKTERPQVPEVQNEPVAQGDAVSEATLEQFEEPRFAWICMDLPCKMPERPLAWPRNRWAPRVHRSLRACICPPRSSAMTRRGS